MSGRGVARVVAERFPDANRLFVRAQENGLVSGVWERIPVQDQDSP